MWICLYYCISCLQFDFQPIFMFVYTPQVSRRPHRNLPVRTQSNFTPAARPQQVHHSAQKRNTSEMGFNASDPSFQPTVVVTVSLWVRLTAALLLSVVFKVWRNHRHGIIISFDMMWYYWYHKLYGIFYDFVNSCRCSALFSDEPSLMVMITIENESNSTADALQVHANLQQ